MRTFIFFCPLGFLSTPSARRATFIFPRTFAVTEIFLSTPSARRATQFGPLFLPNGKNFYPRPPRGGRRTTKKPAVTVSMISIHALREEGDVRVILLWTSTPRFLSTPSARRATSYRRRGRGVIHDFYPRPPRGGRRLHHVLRNVPQDISIHALREEGDKSTSFSSCSSLEFLSTPSARRATQMIICCAPSTKYFYPRPPRGGRPYLHTLEVRAEIISIHALREEGDLSTGRLRKRQWRFLSTPSARRATRKCRTNHPRVSNFYPRPPRGGRPSPPPGCTCNFSYFYPRPPRGGRLSSPSSLGMVLSTPSARRATSVAKSVFEGIGFLSTPSARRATPLGASRARPQFISIHALREEGDADGLAQALEIVRFLSTPSARRATSL